jgi:DNA-binding transcriptional ArsR family regulator
MKTYEKYADEIPTETKLVVATFDDPIRQSIIVLLKTKGKMSFSSVKNELRLDKLTLNYHLKKLYSAGLIDHFFEHELGNREYSYYSITSLGERLLKNLVQILIPESPLVGRERREPLTQLYKFNTSDLTGNKNEVAYTKDFAFFYAKNFRSSIPSEVGRIVARTDATRYTEQKW